MYLLDKINITYNAVTSLLDIVDLQYIMMCCEILKLFCWSLTLSNEQNCIVVVKIYSTMVYFNYYNCIVIHSKFDMLQIYMLPMIKVTGKFG